VLGNNAGVLRPGRLLDNPMGFAESLAVMVQGPYLLIRALAPGMVRRDYGRIVNVSSGWGSLAEGIGGPSGYGVAKAALNALTVAVAQELPATVMVNAMCPGWVRTRMGGAGAPRSPEQGADTAVWLSTLPEGGPSGGFFRDRRPIPW
jgi:NAD(P)-dependent dehydrogenase (short-subunit alcohol dehydrogenase family)